jgi:hypothetical protein
MKGIATLLTDKQESFVGSILFTGMSTHGTCLGGVVGIDFDCHTLMQERFVGNHAMQLSKGPLGRGSIGLTLLLRGFLALASLRSLSNVSQVLKANEGMWVLFDNPFAHDMIGVLLQPSLSSTNRYQTASSRASAFVLKTLPQSCIMISFLNNGCTRIEGTITFGSRGHGKVAYANIHPNHARMYLRNRVGYLYLKGYQEIELLTHGIRNE